MKLPYPITPARVHHNEGIRGQHVLLAITILPTIAFIAYVAARLMFSIPN